MLRLRPMSIPAGEQHDAQSYAIIGAAMEVHRELGCGFLERAYQEALAMELSSRGIPFKREVKFAIVYKSRLLPLTYVVDFVCYDSVVVEVKALAAIGPNERAQAINYLRVSGLKRGLLLNFGARSLQCRRVVWDQGTKLRHEEGVEVLCEQTPGTAPAPQRSINPLIEE
jgi:GxxExxY protein